METHRFDPVSFVFGLLFVALALVGLLDGVTLRVVDLRWLGPIVLVLAGILLVVTAGRGRSPEPRQLEPDEPADEPAGHHDG